MELELEGNDSITIIGDAEITLPDYMTMLPQEELNECRENKDQVHLIIAAGRHPNGDIVAVTANMKFMCMKHGEFGIPDGQVEPIDCGQTLRIDERNYEMATDWFIDNAPVVDISFLASLDTTYLQDVKTT